jgi:hypothetical protein
MRTKALLVLALCAGLAASIAVAGTTAKAAKTTVGDFAVQVATALGDATPDATKAAATLRSRGVNLSANLSATLTEGEAARIMADLGVAVVAPTDPSTPVSTVKAAALAGMMTNAVTGHTVNDGLPTQCLSSINRGNCQDCCKAATGCGDLVPPAPFQCNVCAKFCKNNVPPVPSDPEPQP